MVGRRKPPQFGTTCTSRPAGQPANSLPCDVIAQPRARTRGSHRIITCKTIVERTRTQKTEQSVIPQSLLTSVLHWILLASFGRPHKFWTMIDHILGRPSQRLKSLQVLLVLIAWTGYLIRGNRHGPYFVRRISRRLSNKLTTWQSFCMTMTGLYLLKNMDKLLGLGGLDPASQGQF